MADIPGGDEEQYTLRVTLKNLLSGEAEVVAASLERMEEGAEDAARAGKVLEEQNERTAKSMAKEAAAAKAAGAATNDFGDEQVKAAIAGKMLERQNKRTHKGMLGYIKFGLRFNAVFSAYKIYVIADALQFVATAINGVGAAAIAAVNGLAPLTGLVFSLPGGLAAAIQSLAAFKVGLGGMGDALGVLLDPEATAQDVRKAMKDLSPSARMVLTTVAKLKGEWKDLKQDVQESLMFGMAPTIQGLAHTYLPMLRSGLKGTAAELNAVIRDTGAWLQRADVQRDMESIFGINTQVAGSIGRAGQAGIRMLVDILVAAAPMVERMADDFESLMNSLSNTLHGRRNEFSEWLEGAYDTWLKWWNGIKLYGKALYNVFKASGPLTKAMGEDLTEVGEKFLAWTESKRGQRMMREWFTEMIPVVRELGNWIISIGEEWFNLTRGDNDSFIKTSQMLRKELLPALIEFANTTANKFIPKLVELITLWVHSPTFPTDAFSEFLDILVKFSRAIIGFTSSLPPSWQHFISQLFALSLFLKIQPAFILAFLKFPFRGVGNMLRSHLVQPFKDLSWQMKVLRGGAGLAGLGLLLSDFGEGADRTGRSVAFMKDAIGGALAGFAVGGPWGAAVGTAIGTLYGLWEAFGDTGGIELGKAALQDYTSVLDQQTAAFTKNTRAAVANSLEVSGALEAARKLGIETSDVVTAVMRPKSDTARSVMSQIEALASEEGNTFLERMGQGYSAAANMLAKMIGVEDLPILKDPRLQEQFLNEPQELAALLGMETKDLLGDQKALKRRLEATDKVKDDVKEVEKSSKNTASWWDRIRNDINVIGDLLNNMPSFLGSTLSSATNMPPPVWGMTARFKGGPVEPKALTLVGEAGAEAFVDRLGKISMVGTHGPELRQFSTPGAIIPASATADPFRGATGNAPSWAVDALRNAYTGATGTSAGPTPVRPSEGGSVTQKHYHYHGGPVYPQNEMDVESAAERAWRRLHEEAGERE